jgi:hypothetical protein
MPIKARLRGDSFDLGVLAELFPPPSDPIVGTDSSGYYLTSASLTDDLTADGGAMYDAASSLLRAVNGAARLRSSVFRPVELDGHFSDPAGNVHAVARPGTAEARVHVPQASVWGSQPPRPPLAPRHVQLADKHPKVKEVLAILGRPEPALDWFDLYKIYEIICVHVTRGPKCRQNALTATGWVKRGDLDAFKASANHQGASGDAARHARQSGPPPTRTMTIEDARRLIRVLVSRWLDSL